MMQPQELTTFNSNNNNNSVIIDLDSDNNDKQNKKTDEPNKHGKCEKCEMVKKIYENKNYNEAELKKDMKKLNTQKKTSDIDVEADSNNTKEKIVRKIIYFKPLTKNSLFFARGPSGWIFFNIALSTFLIVLRCMNYYEFMGDGFFMLGPLWVIFWKALSFNLAVQQRAVDDLKDWEIAEDKEGLISPAQIGEDLESDRMITALFLPYCVTPFFVALAMFNVEIQISQKKNAEKENYVPYNFYQDVNWLMIFLPFIGYTLFLSLTGFSKGISWWNDSRAVLERDDESA